MPLKSRSYQMGNVHVIVHDGDTDDILPMHQHNENDIHFTIVARGSVRVHGGVGDKVFRSGAMIDFLPDVTHEFVCLEPNTRFYNILKNVGS